MPIYINGNTAGRPAERPAVIIKRILEAISESGRIGDLSRFSESDMAYVRTAMAEIADKSVKRIFSRDLMSGIDINRVVDVFETSSGVPYALAD